MSREGDRTQAEALRLAREYLEKMGWRYTPKDIGKTARSILSALAQPDDSEQQP